MKKKENQLSKKYIVFDASDISFEMETYFFEIFHLN